MQTSTEDYRHLDDPALLAERARVRTQLERAPARTPEQQALTQRAALLDAELAVRAGLAADADPAA
jgi:hypothetical protein